jgi:hypothetical protein
MGRKGRISARDSGRRYFTVTIPPDIQAAVYEFMDREQFMTESAALAALVRIALSSTPEAAMTSVSRMQAYNETRRWMMQQVAIHFQDILKTMEEGNIK